MIKKPSFDFKIEKLSENINVCVTKDHTFSTDSFLLADFSKPKRKDITCDLGTGCGIIPLYWAKYYCPKISYGVDIMKKAIEQFRYSLSLSMFENTIIPIHSDIKIITERIKKNSCTLVSINPPFKPIGTGFISKDTSQKVARHETMIDTRDIVKSASLLLSFGGRFVICQRPERLFEITSVMKEFNIEPKKLKFVKSTVGKKPWLFLLEGKKGAKPFLQVLPDLIIRNENGYTKEMMDIYKNYQN